MSEVWARLLVVASVLGVAALIGMLISRRGRSRPIPALTTGIDPGVYLFTSAGCADCLPARQALVDVLGSDGFVEVRWEESPDLFTEAGIDVVPSTLIVKGGGPGTVFRGQPTEALRALGP